MTSDFSINALLGLRSAEQREVSQETNKDGGLSIRRDVNSRGESLPHSEGTLSFMSSSFQSDRLTADQSGNSSGLLTQDTRLPAEYTTIVIPKKETKPRRKRTAFSNIQLYFLEEFFQKKAYPSSHERNFIASILSIGSGQVKTWFQNRRTKWKKSNFADCEKPTLGSPSFPGIQSQHSIGNAIFWCPGLPRPTVVNSSCNTQVSYSH